MANLAAHGTTVSGAISTVTLARDVQRVEVLNRHATAELWATVDGADPAAGADEVYVIPAGFARVIPSTSRSNTVIKVIAADAVPFSVTAA